MRRRINRHGWQTSIWLVIAAAMFGFPARVLAGEAETALLAALRASVCFADTFDSAENAKRGKAVEGVAGQALSVPYMIGYDATSSLSRSAGTISWWAKMDFDVKQTLLLGMDSGALYANIEGESPWGLGGRLWS